MIQYHIYPGGKKRIVTFSYDDGHPNDERLAALFNSYGVKATFHLNGCNYTNCSDKELERLRKIYEGHEISCHTFSHGWPARMPHASLAAEVIRDRQILEQLAGYPVVGMSYPSGSYSSEVISVLDSCGIVYSRTTKSTKNFYLPENPLEWHPSCHHRDALELCDRFLENIDSEWTHPLFYIWGHSHELRSDADWEHIEEILRRIGKNDKIWYATNIEIHDYTVAQKQLRISLDERIFINPTAIDLWVEKDKKMIIRIPAGETVVLGDSPTSPCLPTSWVTKA